MAINVSTNFNLGAGMPLDGRSVKETIAERDAIEEAARYVGMEVKVLEDGETYVLDGGVTNDCWVRKEAKSKNIGAYKWNVNSEASTPLDEVYELKDGAWVSTSKTLHDFEIDDYNGVWFYIGNGSEDKGLTRYKLKSDGYTTTGYDIDGADGYLNCRDYVIWNGRWVRFNVWEAKASTVKNSDGKYSAKSGVQGLMSPTDKAYLSDLINAYWSTLITDTSYNANNCMENGLYAPMVLGRPAGAESDERLGLWVIKDKTNGGVVQIAVSFNHEGRMWMRSSATNSADNFTDWKPVLSGDTAVQLFRRDENGGNLPNWLIKDGVYHGINSDAGGNPADLFNTSNRTNWTIVVTVNPDDSSSVMQRAFNNSNPAQSCVRTGSGTGGSGMWGSWTKMTVEASSANGYLTVNGSSIKVYAHPTTAGNKHLPGGGDEGQVVKCCGDGTGAWGSIEISDVVGLLDRLNNLLADADAMRFRGTIGTEGTIADWAALSSLNYQNGDTYRVVSAGNYAGRVCEVGDMLICVSEEHVGGESELDWTVVQANIDGSVTSRETSVTDGEIPVFDGTTGKVIKKSGLTPRDLRPTFEADTDTASNQEKLTFKGADGDVIKARFSALGSVGGQSELEISTSYTNDTPMVSALGGLAAGTTFDNMSVKEILDKLLYPYVKPAVSLTATANKGGVYEIGSSVSPTFTVVTTKKSNAITSLGLYNGSVLLASNVEVKANGGTQTEVVLDSALTAIETKSVTITAKVSDGTSTVTSGGIVYSFVNPFYWGVVSAAPEDKDTITALTKAVEAKGNKTVTFTTTADKGRYCFCFPKEYGLLSTVSDQNGFDNTEDFTVTTVTIEDNAANNTDYYVYTYNNVVSAGEMIMTFKF